MDCFSGKVALVTGGTQGMGFLTAKSLSEKGATVYICGRNAELGLIATQKINGNAYFYQCDISIAHEVKSMIDKIVDTEGRLDMAFNNAGITTEQKKLADSSIDEWKKAVDINILGTYYCMKYELEVMQHTGGSIVNNSSCVGVMPISRQAAYVATKHAVVGLTKSTALEYAQCGQDNKQCVRVNAVAPGPISGGMNSEELLATNPERTKVKLQVTAMKRFGTPEEIANLVSFLLSDDSSYITGAIITIDGGMTSGKF
tara:strand:- start:2746 stop:3519 length:774 start_codon:yes stop_codon:yes gene_type:complete